MYYYHKKGKEQRNQSTSKGIFQRQPIERPLAVQIIDNRHTSRIQKKLQGISKSPAIQKKEKAIGDNQQDIIQMVAIKSQWLIEKVKYEAHNVGKNRLVGDALWLAMTRFAKDISTEFKANHTVEEVLEEAAKIKMVSFEDWKGKQAEGTSQEAQHLVTSTFATTVLKWSYSEINCEDNGKMLLAGRGGKGERTSDAYNEAKKKRHPFAAAMPFFSSATEPSRGNRHIGNKGFTHPEYSEVSKNYLMEYYQLHELTIGQPIDPHHYKAIKQGLRIWHKEGDRTSTLTIDERAAIDPPLVTNEQCIVM